MKVRTTWTWCALAWAVCWAQATTGHDHAHPVHLIRIFRGASGQFLEHTSSGTQISRTVDFLAPVLLPVPQPHPHAFHTHMAISTLEHAGLSLRLRPEGAEMLPNGEPAHGDLAGVRAKQHGYRREDDSHAVFTLADVLQAGQEDQGQPHAEGDSQWREQFWVTAFPSITSATRAGLGQDATPSEWTPSPGMAVPHVGMLADAELAWHAAWEQAMLTRNLTVPDALRMLAAATAAGYGPAAITLARLWLWAPRVVVSSDMLAKVHATLQVFTAPGCPHLPAGSPCTPCPFGTGLTLSSMEDAAKLLSMGLAATVQSMQPMVDVARGSYWRTAWWQQAQAEYASAIAAELLQAGITELSEHDVPAPLDLVPASLRQHLDVPGATPPLRVAQQSSQRVMRAVLADAGIHIHTSAQQMGLADARLDVPLSEYIASLSQADLRAADSVEQAALQIAGVALAAWNDVPREGLVPVAPDLFAAAEVLGAAGVQDTWETYALGLEAAALLELSNVPVPLLSEQPGATMGATWAGLQAADNASVFMPPQFQWAVPSALAQHDMLASQLARDAGAVSTMLSMLPRPQPKRVEPDFVDTKASNSHATGPQLALAVLQFVSKFNAPVAQATIALHHAHGSRGSPAMCAHASSSLAALATTIVQLHEASAGASGFGLALRYQYDDAATPSSFEARPTAVGYYQALAFTGDGDAAEVLGELYYHGDPQGGVPQDMALARHMFRIAAERGVAAGHANLGVMYINGFGAEDDAVHAAADAAHAADGAGGAGAPLEQGEVHPDGHVDAAAAGGAAGAAGAARVAGAPPGEPAAQPAAGGQQRHRLQITEDGRVLNISGAKYHFEQAVALGSIAAHNGLGYMALHGMEGGVPNPAEAARHFQAAADGGALEAHGNLAIMYLQGNGVPLDTAKARYHLEQATAHPAHAGLHALLNMALMELHGWDGPQNCSAALKMLKFVVGRGLWVMPGVLLDPVQVHAGFASGLQHARHTVARPWAVAAVPMGTIDSDAVEHLPDGAAVWPQWPAGPEMQRQLAAAHAAGHGSDISDHIVYDTPPTWIQRIAALFNGKTAASDGFSDFDADLPAWTTARAQSSGPELSSSLSALAAYLRSQWADLVEQGATLESLQSELEQADVGLPEHLPRDVDTPHADSTSLITVLYHALFDVAEQLTVGVRVVRELTVALFTGLRPWAWHRPAVLTMPCAARVSHPHCSRGYTQAVIRRAHTGSATGTPGWRFALRHAAAMAAVGFGAAADDAAFLFNQGAGIADWGPRAVTVQRMAATEQSWDGEHRQPWLSWYASTLARLPTVVPRAKLSAWVHDLAQLEPELVVPPGEASAQHATSPRAPAQSFRGAWWHRPVVDFQHSYAVQHARAAAQGVAPSATAVCSGASSQADCSPVATRAATQLWHAWRARHAMTLSIEAARYDDVGGKYSVALCTGPSRAGQLFSDDGACACNGTLADMLLAQAQADHSDYAGAAAALITSGFQPIRAPIQAVRDVNVTGGLATLDSLVEAGLSFSPFDMAVRTRLFTYAVWMLGDRSRVAQSSVSAAASVVEAMREKREHNAPTIAAVVPPVIAQPGVHVYTAGSHAAQFLYGAFRLVVRVLGTHPGAVCAPGSRWQILPGYPLDPATSCQAVLVAQSVVLLVLTAVVIALIVDGVQVRRRRREAPHVAG